MSLAKDKVVQNIKIIKVMKSSGYKDSDIAKYLDMTTKELMAVIEGDDYLRDVYDNASNVLASDIESKFLEKMMDKLEKGDTTDAKWTLERTNSKYMKKEQVEVNMKSIDDIIREGSE